MITKKQSYVKPVAEIVDGTCDCPLLITISNYRLYNEGIIYDSNKQQDIGTIGVADKDQEVGDDEIIGEAKHFDPWSTWEDWDF